MNRTQFFRLLPLLLALLLAILLASGLLIPATRKEQAAAPVVGTPLPSFSLPLLSDSSLLFLPALWKEQTAVINIFASWCEPCRVEHPLLSQLAARGTKIYGVAWRDTEANIKQYLSRLGDPYQAVGLDAFGRTTLIFGIAGVPETYVLDAKGIVRWKHAGPLTPDVVSGQLLPLLQKLSAPR